MDIVKKNIVSILCGVVAIVAIIALVWPVSGMYESLQGELAARAQTHQEIEALRTAERNLPSLELETSERDKLGRFPNEAVIKVGLEKTGALSEQSARMLATVSEGNVHPILVEGSLPRPTPLARSEFPGIYLEALGQGEPPPAEPGKPQVWSWDTGLPAALKATRPPSTEEINMVAQEVWDKKYTIRVFDIGGQNNLQQISAEFAAEVQNLPDQEREKRATSHKIYLDDASLQAHPEIQVGRQPTEIQIWFAQTVYWIQRDVVDAINVVNGNAKNVLDAPVKHLVSLTVPFGPEQYVLASRLTPGAGGEGAAAIPVDANGAPAVFTASPTGRVSNDLYDVVHFDLVLRVDYRRIPQILAELERNRLFTVLSTGISSVDAAEERRQSGYVYGNDPVAELSLTVEALFLRSWTVDKEHEYKNAIMPEVIQQTVGAKPGPGLQGGGGPPGGYMGGPPPGMGDPGMGGGEMPL